MSLGKLTSPSIIRELLNGLGHRPNKGLGQNYLIDSNILGIIVTAAEISESDQLLEIGPGLGALTQALLATGAKVTAIEKDKTMALHLRETFCDKNPPRPSGTPPVEGMDEECRMSNVECPTSNVQHRTSNIEHPMQGLPSKEGCPKGGVGSADELQNLELLEDDVLNVNLNELFAGGVNKIIANLPYSVGSRFIVNALEATPLPERMVFLVQKEVADRLTAQPGGKAFGPLAIWSQLNYEVKAIKKVSPNCFLPAPKVWSSVVQFKKRSAPLAEVTNYEQFKALVKVSFSQRRKQIGSNLRKNAPEFFHPPSPDGSGVTRALEKCGIEPTTRPEQIAITQWVALAETPDNT